MLFDHERSDVHPARRVRLGSGSGSVRVPTETPARRAARSLLRRRRRTRRDRAAPLAPTARRFRAVVAYDGTRWAGWQRQHEAVGVQEILEAALEAATGAGVSCAAAGRTDAGVHAEGQVVAFSCATGLPATALKHLCDQLLPDDVRVLRVEDAPEGFDPQHDAVRKLYRYTLLVAPEERPALRSLAWRIDRRPDLPAMERAAALLVGTHDFRAFRNDPGPERRDEGTVRTVEALTVAAAWDLVRIEAVGPGFLYMMVRNLTAALVAVGLGEREPAWVAEVLASRDRRRLPPPAPAQGLTLVRVEYGSGWPGGSPAHPPSSGTMPPGPGPERSDTWKSESPGGMAT